MLDFVLKTCCICIYLVSSVLLSSGKECSVLVLYCGSGEGRGGVASCMVIHRESGRHRLYNDVPMY